MPSFAKLMPYSLAWDLDGTLFDTKPVVLRSYDRARPGAGALAEANWGKPWEAWGPSAFGEDAESIHRAKTTHYQRAATKSQLLPPGVIARAHPGQSFILTGASRESSLRLAARLAIKPERVYTGLTPERKAEVIATDLAQTGVYVDDDEVAGVRVVNILRERGLFWYFVLFHGQTERELDTQIGGILGYRYPRRG